jgi:hypothetical protein
MPRQRGTGSLAKTNLLCHSLAHNIAAKERQRAIRIIVIDRTLCEVQRALWRTQVGIMIL